jgi:nitroimidazol reductase NimA-like FMN-containing flavoprotein (pyridoxamine 5'-phosphate oxidase superfamily)
MLGTLKEAEVERLLRSQYIGRLGVCDQGRPYIFPVSYGYDGTYVYAHSHVGLKIHLMRVNPQVCFEVEDIVSAAQWRTVVAHGTFEEVVDKVERDAALAAIVRQTETAYAPSLAPYIDGPEQIIVYRIRLTEKTGRYERTEVLQVRRGHG